MTEELLTSHECKSPEPLNFVEDDILTLKEIGHGSYGKIYKIMVNNKLMAMKYVKKSPSMGVRVLMESYIMKYLKNKYINSCIDIKLDDFGNCQIFQPLALMDVMSFVRQFVISLPVLKRWIWQLMCAIAHLHSNGIIHGDIKASNILLKKEDMVCNLDNLSDVDILLSDFGLSILILDPIEGTRNFNKQRPSYTPTNRPPEVCKEKSFSYAAEMWALGCTIYEMAYGEPLFPLQTRVQEHIYCIDDFCSHFSTNPHSQVSTQSNILHSNSQVSRTSTQSNILPPNSRASTQSNILPPNSRASTQSNILLPNSRASTQSNILSQMSQMSTQSNILPSNSRTSTQSNILPSNSQISRTSTQSNILPPNSRASTQSNILSQMSQMSRRDNMPYNMGKISNHSKMSQTPNMYQNNSVEKGKKVYFRQAHVYNNNRWKDKDMMELNNIIVSLLQRDEDDRPTIFELLSLPFFEDVKRVEDLPEKMCYPVFDFPLFTEDEDHVQKYAKYLKEKFKEHGGLLTNNDVFIFMAYKILYGSLPNNSPPYTYDISIQEIEICKKLSFNFYTES
jgi:serine/threonine protein kinase